MAVGSAGFLSFFGLIAVLAPSNEKMVKNQSHHDVFVRTEEKEVETKLGARQTLLNIEQARKEAASQGEEARQNLAQAERARKEATALLKQARSSVAVQAEQSRQKFVQAEQARKEAATLLEQARKEAASHADQARQEIAQSEQGKREAASGGYARTQSAGLVEYAHQETRTNAITEEKIEGTVASESTDKVTASDEDAQQAVQRYKEIRDSYAQSAARSIELFHSALKDPSSAAVREIRTNQLPGERSALCGLVNAKNSFGAFTGYQRFVAVGDLNVVEFERNDGAAFESAWNNYCFE